MSQNPYTRRPVSVAKNYKDYVEEAEEKEPWLIDYRPTIGNEGLAHYFHKEFRKT